MERVSWILLPCSVQDGWCPPRVHDHGLRMPNIALAASGVGQLRARVGRKESG